MLDKYLYGNAERVSPEAPVMVLHYQHEELRLGGAANVASDARDAGRESEGGRAVWAMTRPPRTSGG